LGFLSAHKRIEEEGWENFRQPTNDKSVIAGKEAIKGIKEPEKS
jgi:hypothetical protein